MNLILGYFGFHTNQLDGQTVKTRSLYKLVTDRGYAINFFDSQDLHYNKLSIFRLIRLTVRSNKILYLPAHNNLKYFLPPLFFISKLTGSKIYYFVIGGWLTGFISKLPFHRWMLSHIEHIYAETSSLRNNLETEYGFKNVSIFYNFRQYDFIPQNHHLSGKLRLTYMARINAMKGLDMIFSLGDFIIKEKLDKKISVDIYGPIDADFKDIFYTQVDLFSFMTYKGVLQPEDIYKTLENYDALLFPTHFFTEGLPGTIIDAYISGLPVIATKWKYATEFIDDRETGLIVPFDNGQKEFNNSIVYLLENEPDLIGMKQKAFEKSGLFSSEKVWKQLKEIVRS